MMWFQSLLQKILPEPPIMRAVVGLTLGAIYGDWWSGSREKLANWHRRELRRLDRQFDLQEEGNDLVRQRMDADRRGIGPLDPRYPSRDIGKYLS